MRIKLKEQIKQFQKTYKVTNIELAEALGITPSNYCKRAKKGNITIDELDKLGEDFGFEIKIVKK